MVSETEYEKIVGNTYFYLDIYKFRQRTFLQRNLRSALKYHEERLKRSETSKKSQIDSQPSVEDRNDHDQGTWRFPDHDILNTLSKGQSPILKIDVKEIRRRAREAGKLSGLTQSHGNMLWLFTTSCLVDLRIYQDGNRLCQRFNHSVIWCDKKWGAIECFRDEMHETALSIKLDEPFLVELKHFLASAGKQQNRNKTVPASNRLVLTISFKDSKDAHDVIRLLGISDDSPVAVGEPYLRVSYYELPTCPPPNRLLTICADHMVEKRPPGIKSTIIQLNHGIQLEMGWTQALDSPLKLYNRVYQATQIPARANAVHRTALEPFQNESQKCNRVEVTYIFPANSDTSTRVTLKGFSCVLCNKRDFLSAEQLHFHLDRSHDRFSFTIKNEGAGNSTTSDNVALHVHVKLGGGSDNSDADTKTRRPIWWQAPRRHFNIAEFLGGDRCWIADFHPPIPRKEQMPLRNSLPRSIHYHFPIPAIKELNRGVRGKYRVPRAPPNITFFRTVSKRPLVEGEMLSESDDDVDEAWLRIKHEASIESMTYLSAQEKTFIKLWDSHFQDEDLSGDKFVPNALLRFVYANRTSLRDDSMGLEFLKKAAQLMMDGVISGATTVTCLHIIKAAEPDAPTSNTIDGTTSGRNGVIEKGNHTTPAEENEKSRSVVKRTRRVITDSSQDEMDVDEHGQPPRPIPEERSGAGHSNNVQVNQSKKQRNHTEHVRISETTRPSSGCICGQAIVDLSGAVACSNPVRHFHKLRVF